MAEFLFGFKDLVNVSNPNTPIFNLGSLLISDNFVRKFNPKRYNFYVKFVNGLSDPANLYRFLYTTKDSKSYHQTLQTKIENLNKSLKSLNTEDKQNVIEKLKLLLNTKDKSKNSEQYNNLFDVIEKIKGGNYIIKKRNMPMETFINEINNVAPNFNEIPPKTIDEIVIDSSAEGAAIPPVIPKNIDIKQIKNVYDSFKNLHSISPDRIKINLMDRIIFIITTGIIRLIALSLIYWGLNSNLINNFNTAFKYYCLIYILFFIFLIAIVNVIYYYPVVELFSNISIVSIPNLLYYFYIHINGMNRLILHLLIIITLLFIPYILSMDKKIIEQTNLNISFDYSQKNNIYNTISNFSLVVWILTSIIAIKF